MFSNFSIDKLTDSISNVAIRTQENLSNAITNVNTNIENILNDPNTKLSIKARSRYIQEQLGTLDDEISKLPQQYIELEIKTDSVEKILKRLLLVTNTYSVEGYDYPPNLTESISDWWGEDQSKNEGGESTFLPRSFAQAISKASLDSKIIISKAEQNIKLETVNKQDAGDDAEEDEEEDEDLVTMTKTFDSMANSYKNIDNGKDEMDKMIVNEFNKKLNQLLNEDFKDVNKLRKNVENSRLKFDTMRYEAKLKEIQEEKAKAAEAKAAENKTETSDKKEDDGKELENTEEKSPASNLEEPVKKEEKTSESKSSNDSNDDEDADHKLLEQLEDEFVSNTAAAVEKMEELTDSAKVLDLVKLFQNFQLVYYRQCVQEIEKNLKNISDLEILS